MEVEYGAIIQRYERIMPEEKGPGSVVDPADEVKKMMENIKKQKKD